MSGWWVQVAWNIGPAYLVSWIFWVLFSITLHELAHGWAALSQGDQTPRELNRMTANPLVQMGTTSLIFFFIIGIETKAKSPIMETAPAPIHAGPCPPAKATAHRETQKNASPK